MAERDLLNAFDDCIDRLAAGNSVEACLRRYPHYASALRPMLEAGRMVYRVRLTSTEIIEAQDRVRFQVTQAVSNRRQQSQPRILPFAPLVAGLILIFALAFGVTSILAESSLPGDSLYAMKRLTENIRMFISNNQEVLESQFSQRRISEIEHLVAQQREAEVVFEGEVESIDGTDWLIAGLRINISSEISIPGSIQVGSRVEVSAATTRTGQIVAASIRVTGGEPTPPSTLPTNVPSLTPTHTPSSTSSPVSTLTNTATWTPTTTPMSTPISETGCTPTQPQGWAVYSVEPNDTLSGIAASTGATLEVLMRVNCLTDRNLVVTGQRLYVPRLPIRQEPQESPAPRSTASESRGLNDDNSDMGNTNNGSVGDDRNASQSEAERGRESGDG